MIFVSWGMQARQRQVHVLRKQLLSTRQKVEDITNANKQLDSELQELQVTVIERQKVEELAGERN